ncbi:hypothetical protein L228DRAFT_170006 [Xylona heveae TC161]|uniref:Uncharacterized protein n=1 Tax=Xylona heveae (strain CBS 132557 / TC161) TaxID=1328760 RepID=A0A165FRN4_XYLHT|nr:hypothetical protein L228DRAFT_170006 [Xylona heveae TC161]KZF21295.1 hypothetical protein L228DRAFT_170006 [Xylona heveae TC161]
MSTTAFLSNHRLHVIVTVVMMVAVVCFGLLYHSIFFSHPLSFPFRHIMHCHGRWTHVFFHRHYLCLIRLSLPQVVLPYVAIESLHRTCSNLHMLKGPASANEAHCTPEAHCEDTPSLSPPSLFPPLRPPRFLPLLPLFFAVP